LSFNGIGCATEISYIQVHRSYGRSISFSGGTVHADHLIATGGESDHFDLKNGYRGSIQFAVAQVYGDCESTARGIQVENNELNFDAMCRTNPTLANLTLINTQPDYIYPRDGIFLQRGADAQIYNSISMFFLNSGLQLRHHETVARGVYPQTGVQGSGDITIFEPEPGSPAVTINSWPNPWLPARDGLRLSIRVSNNQSTSSLGRQPVQLIDINGRIVHVLELITTAPGIGIAQWNGRLRSGETIPAGVYLLRMPDRITADKRPVIIMD
jgi:hypothetical protein